MLGRIKNKIERVVRFDPALAYARDITRPRILKSPPVSTTNKSAELHVLTSHKDWLNLVWSLKSFYKFVEDPYALVIHGDGSLPPKALDAFSRHFPNARVVRQSEAREHVLDSLASYPRCRQFRETNTLSIKVFDFLHYLTVDKMILFDSDLLFFARPNAFLAYLDDDSRKVNRFNRDVSTAYAIPFEDIQAAGYSIEPEVNSGFGLIHKESMPLDWLEEFLEIPGLAEGHFWRIEQTLYALCATRFGVELLPDDYRVFLEGSLGERPFRHYVGAVREKMYTEGMRMLRRQLA